MVFSFWLFISMMLNFMEGLMGYKNNFYTPPIIIFANQFLISNFQFSIKK